MPTTIVRCILLGIITLVALPAISAPSMHATVVTDGTCSMKGNWIDGRGFGSPLPAFLRVSTKDGRLRELLPLPRSQSEMIQTEGLLPLEQSDTWVDVDCSRSEPPDEFGNVSLSGETCDYKHYAVVDNGPRAIFTGAARNKDAAVIRVQIVQEKYFASGTVTLDDWVGFSVDGGPQIALAAKGVEPVTVTAYFPHLSAGHHRVEISTFEGWLDGGAAQGTVCL